MKDGKLYCNPEKWKLYKEKRNTAKKLLETAETALNTGKHHLRKHPALANFGDWQIKSWECTRPRTLVQCLIPMRSYQPTTSLKLSISMTFLLISAKIWLSSLILWTFHLQTPSLIESLQPGTMLFFPGNL